MRPYMDVVAEAGELHKTGDLQKAAYLYENLIGSVPDDPIALFLYGTLRSQLKEFGTAIVMLEKSASLEGGQLPEVWHNLAVAYRSEGHTEKSVKAYEKALELDPNRGDTWSSLSGCYVNNGTPERAVECAERALAINPDCAHARNHMALALLEMGKYKKAWPYYSSRFQLQNMSSSVRPFECPKWDGKKVGTLAIHGEQGIGDEILFMSCFEDAARLADKIVIEAEHRMCELFERSFGVPCYPSFATLIKNEKPDAYIAMGDLGGLFRNKKSDFPGKPFLKAHPDKVARWKARLGDNAIGLAWHGGTKSTHQELRNAPLSLWAELVAAGGNFVSLQYGEDGQMQADQLGIPHYQEGIDGLDEFAAMVAACSVVVTVCQSAVHFAGGLGVPCMVLTPKAYAWRYHGDMPWYGSVKLYRQSGDDWLEPFINVGKDIAHYRGIQAAE